jgi:hypothetical protein
VDINDPHIATFCTYVKGKIGPLPAELVRDLGYARARLDETERRLALGHGHERLAADRDWYQRLLRELVEHFKPRLALPKNTADRWYRLAQACETLRSVKHEREELREFGAPWRMRDDAYARELIALREWEAVRIARHERDQDHELMARRKHDGIVTHWRNSP